MKTTYILFIIIFIFSIACRNSDIPAPLQEIIKVKVAKVDSGKVSIPLHTNGFLVSSEELKLSFKTGGIVSKIFVNEGARVKKGDLLASLNLSEINANTDQAESGYAKALRDFERAENLYRDSVVTLEQKQNAATALRIARSNLEIVQFNLNHSKIYAPDNGLILRQFVKENELVSSGYPVFLFGTSGEFWKVKAGFPDKDIIKINQGDSASISFDAHPGVSFSAIVDQVGEMANPLTGTFEIELLLKESEYRLVSGFVAGVDLFPLLRKTFSIVPLGAIVEADGKEGYIYSVNEDKIAQKVKVNIVTLVGSMVAVTGIPPGISLVVSEGAAYLKNGTKVEIVK